MFAHLPKLSGILHFEAVARHLSFTLAGDELGVTTAAVSYQIRVLEGQLGQRLFTRHNKSIELTEAGRLFYGHCHQALMGVSHGVEALQGAKDGGILRISVLPSFAKYWLIPRLSQFYAAEPDIQLYINATQSVINFASSPEHAAIRYGLGQWAGVLSRPLWKEKTFPVCSPGYAQQLGPNYQLDDLSSAALLHDSAVPWDSFFSLLGRPHFSIPSGSVFDDSGLLLFAATAGQGVALAREHLVENALKSGELVRLGDEAVEAKYAYYFVCPLENWHLPKVQRFYQWLCRDN